MRIRPRPARYTGPALPRRANPILLPGGGLTLLELLVTIGIITILTMIALPQAQLFLTRSKIAASKSHLRMVSEALEIYRSDHGSYPQPVISSPTDDPYGVVATASLRALTTPIAYINPVALRDSFGLMEAQLSVGQTVSTDPLRPPTPDDPLASPEVQFNPTQSLLYFYYPALAGTIGSETMKRECFALISVGPDAKDSFIVYYPFPGDLPATAAQYGIIRIEDTIYDPTNGVESGGDLASFGPEAHTAPVIGGGEN